VKEVILNQSQLDILTEHAMKSGQDESCAMLLGVQKEEQWNVKEIFLTQNVDASPEVEFTISPEELLSGYKHADEKHLELVGIFHSHPKSIALPSNTDQKFMGLNGDIPWIIFSGLTTNFKAFILKEDVEEIKIRIIERHFFQ
jgi:proteasome lid subunit RPN8/RPN11